MKVPKMPRQNPAHSHMLGNFLDALLKMGDLEFGPGCHYGIACAYGMMFCNCYDIANNS